MSASVMPSAKYSCAGSFERFASGSTASDWMGPSGSRVTRARAPPGRDPISRASSALAAIVAIQVVRRAGRGWGEVMALGTLSRSRSTSSSRADW